MSNTIIHIGFHKSASTFLQKNIFPNIKVNYSFLSSGNRDILDNIENKHYYRTKSFQGFQMEVIELYHILLQII